MDIRTKSIRYSYEGGHGVRSKETKATYIFCYAILPLSPSIRKKVLPRLIEVERREKPTEAVRQQRSG